MLQSRSLKCNRLLLLRMQPLFHQNCRSYSSRYGDGENAAEIDAARKWFSNFNENTIPTTLAKTSFSRSSGPGGQKVNKTSSKATTVWPMDSLQHHVPRLFHPELRASRYYARSSNTMSIQCDVHRNQNENEEETHKRLHDEIRQIYRRIVPGLTSPEQKKRVDALKKADNSARLRLKKMHSDKKSSRKGGIGAEF